MLYFCLICVKERVWLQLHKERNSCGIWICLCKQSRNFFSFFIYIIDHKTFSTSFTYTNLYAKTKIRCKVSKDIGKTFISPHFVNNFIEASKSHRCMPRRPQRELKLKWKATCMSHVRKQFMSHFTVSTL